MKKTFAIFAAVALMAGAAQAQELSNFNFGGRQQVVSPEIKDGQVSVTEASCPDKVCVNHGPTDQTADPIVCLPNKLVVRVLAPGDDPNQLDGVSS